MNTDTTTMNFVMAILAVGSAAAPIIFGFALWRMSQVFVSKESFDEFKRITHDERQDLRRRLDAIEHNTLELLQRTAKLRNKDERD